MTQSLNVPNPLMNGVIIVDKPAGLTSHDVVNRMRRILKQRSVGHLGTLDPLATGVLPLVTGNLTRLAQFYTASEKSYEGVIRFGFSTTTYDADGEPVGNLSVNVGTAAQACPERSRRGCPNLMLSELQQFAAGFLGQIEQIPPPFSAKKIHGVPAYKLARRQKEVLLAPVQIEIKEFTVTAVDGEHATFRARVSAGTYMRSVAHEMGQRLGCGAHLESLRRTAVAEFDIAQAHTLEEIAECAYTNGGRSERAHSAGEEPAVPIALAEVAPDTPARGQGSAESQTLQQLFLHPRQLLPQFPSVTADEATAARIRNGRTVNLPELSRARHVKVFAGQSELLAIATRVAGTLFHSKIVFAAQCEAEVPARR
jgi:tRNA pseudouridine55 synthase